MWSFCWQFVKFMRRRYRPYLGRICSRCQEVLENLEILEDDHILPESGTRLDLKLKSLVESEKEHCYICSSIWKDLADSPIAPMDPESVGTITYQLHEDQTKSPSILELDIDFTISIAFVSAPLKVVKFFVLHVESEINQKLGRITSQSTKSEESFKVARKWMDECQTNHHRCRKVLEANYSHEYPKRLIDVSQSETIYLCENFSNKNSRAPYAALSHCWGTRKFECLTDASYKRFVGGVPISEFAQTFQDAIEYTRRLGLRYLWIDSLCIIQDSVVDWQSEAARMDDIYTGSYVTIAATHSSDSFQSLYSERCPDLLNPPTIGLGQRNGASERYCLIDHATWNAGIQDSPLDERGWVLQERLLSSRVLHFGHTQLMWECLEKDATETLPCGLLPGRTPMGDRFRLKNFLPSENPNSEINCTLNGQYEEQWRPHILWCQVVENYSKRLLSHPSDKLIAISGIAKMFSGSFPLSCRRYVAGLWRESIELQLLWHLDDIPTVEPVYRAPSWSWASVDGLVCQPRCWGRGSIKAQVSNVDVGNYANDDYGMVQSARLVIHGELIPITLGTLGSGSNISPYSRYMETIDGTRVPTESENFLRSLDPEVRLDYTETSEAGQLYCVPLFYDETVQELRGLILSQEEAEDHYKRVGTFWSWRFENIDIILQAKGAEGQDNGREANSAKRMSRIVIV